MENPVQKPRDLEKLHEKAVEVQQTLKRLLNEINQLLEKTRRSPKEADQSSRGQNP
ncbi:MAG TPA: hypothetical protein VGY58_02220 [Gemmataceae bacterium]|jgi:hypothetical protein|nr:hypothetical protein [Gemmataceae bacterium]